MKKRPKYSPEVIDRAVRMVGEAASEYSSQWAAIESIAAKIGEQGALRSVEPARAPVGQAQRSNRGAVRGRMGAPA